MTTRMENSLQKLILKALIRLQEDGKEFATTTEIGQVCGMLIYTKEATLQGRQGTDPARISRSMCSVWKLALELETPIAVARHGWRKTGYRIATAEDLALIIKDLEIRAKMLKGNEANARNLERVTKSKGFLPESFKFGSLIGKGGKRLN